MKAKVLKRMTSLGKELEVGDIVEVDNWRHTKALISNRYIVIVSDSESVVEKAEPKKVKKAKVEEAIEPMPETIELPVESVEAPKGK